MGPSDGPERIGTVGDSFSFTSCLSVVFFAYPVTVTRLCRPGLDIVCDGTDFGNLQKVMDHLRAVPNSVSPEVQTRKS